MSGVLIGGGNATLEELALIPVPQATATYVPVSHFDLANKVKAIACDMFRALPTSESFQLARNGNQMFGVITFPGENGTGISVGLRNSTDKSMSIGFCVGAEVFVCSNLSFKGQIVVLKKHTQNVLTALEDSAISILYKARTVYGSLLEDFERLRLIDLDNFQAYKALGVLYGHGVLSPRQLPKALEQWHEPTHDAFKPRNAYSLYNACTEAMKSCPPSDVMEKLTSLHSLTLQDGVWS
jgi:hypothetical protein